MMEPQARMANGRAHGIGSIAIALIVVLTPIYSIVYANLHLDPANYADQGLTDPIVYLQMYRGEPAPPEFRYRVLTIYLARAIPDIPMWVFSEKRDNSQSWQARIHFAMVNSGFLALAAIALFQYLQESGFQVLESLLGAVLFLNCEPVVHSGALPMVDASAYFFLAVGFLAIKRSNASLLALAVLVGAFAKETVFLLVPIVLLNPRDRDARFRMTLAFIPGLAAYLAFRVLVPAEGGRLPESGFQLAQLFLSLRPNRIAGLASSFSSLWLFAGYAFFAGEVPSHLRRWAWFVPLLLIVIVVGGTNLGRIMMLAFPVVIPLALLGIRQVLGKIYLSQPAAGDQTVA